METILMQEPALMAETLGSNLANTQMDLGMALTDGQKALNRC